MLQSILDEMKSGYKDLELFACHQMVNIQDVEEMLANVEADTDDGVCLRILLKYAK